MPTRFSRSARWALRVARCAARWVYWRVRFEVVEVEVVGGGPEGLGVDVDVEEGWWGRGAGVVCVVAGIFFLG